MEEKETSLRDDIAAATESIETEEVSDEVEAETAQETAPQETDEVSDQIEPEQTEQTEQPKQPEQPAEVKAKPPVDWSPEVKAQWAQLTPEVKTAIADRERHINETLQHTVDDRRSIDQFNHMVQPYIPLMQAEGVDNPMQAIDGLLKTTAALSMGTPAQKAQRIAGLIQHYGVDIEILDQTLSGGRDPAESRMEQMLNERLAPVNQLIEQANLAQQSQQQRMSQDVSQDIEAFAADPKHVHFDAVREAMADFHDIAHANGQTITLDESYRRACLSDPSIAPLVTQQEMEAVSQGQQGMLQAKQNAASSITGRPAAVSTSKLTGEMSLREALEAQVGGSNRI